MQQRGAKNRRAFILIINFSVQFRIKALGFPPISYFNLEGEPPKKFQKH